MWNTILDGLETHDTAVLTGYDEHGFPFSVRCIPIADRGGRRLNVEVPKATGIQPGKASILMHSHNEEFWDLVQFLIRGTLVRGGEGYYFVPASIHGSPRLGGTIEAFKTVRAMRARADKYLKRHEIERPKVPWNDIQRLHSEAAERRLSP